MCIPLISGSKRELKLRAQLWRALMSLGMHVHRIARPRAPAPSFRKRIKTTVSPQRGEIDLLFYTPKDYQKPSGSEKAAAKVVAVDKSAFRGYPVVVTFHGGGFTLGKATDDARWADTVVREVNAVVVCVEYRLAPEHPFPTAVEDGVDAILYLVANSDELGIDPHRIATSGFSAGGNMAFTVPLKLQDLLNKPEPDPSPDPDPERERDGTNSMVVTAPHKINPVLNPIVAIAAWYPVTDFATHIKPKRKPSSARPDKDLPKFFTDLFDAAYLQGCPLSVVSLSSPYLSPGLAPVEMLKALPDHIIIYTCEWDMLLLEAERMRDRLTNEAGKEVTYRKLCGVPHAFDKSINPLKWDKSIEQVYVEACESLKKAFQHGNLFFGAYGVSPVAFRIDGYKIILYNHIQGNAKRLDWWFARVSMALHAIPSEMWPQKRGEGILVTATLGAKFKNQRLERNLAGRQPLRKSRVSIY